MSSLKPCPLCGGKAKLNDGQVMCGDCLLATPWWNDDAGAAEQWNTRANNVGLTPFRC
jgi:hypothetical protein